MRSATATFYRKSKYDSAEAAYEQQREPKDENPRYGQIYDSAMEQSAHARLRCGADDETLHPKRGFVKASYV